VDLDVVALVVEEPHQRRVRDRDVVALDVVLDDDLPVGGLHVAALAEALEARDVVALEALGEAAGAACAPARDGALNCLRCGGRPQLACAEASGEQLVSARRSLECSRCTARWSVSRSVCPACGEADEAKLMVYAEQWGDGNGAEPAVFGNLRIVGCTTCRCYLIEVDLERDPRAVPAVDELAALPLDLYAADQGLTKLTTNLMGF
jgi:formate dehydrogenase maturation protein FdhE